ncbi:hypothetical protein HYC85_017364 [Camellia sinensis]|uniref:Myb/SANT-like domain-containing protein n=1 Tax=Camellia sinensis TaxID=4442 RepID=A0A7J7H5U6_CAMSI|nr:hypothetical protein HYC85_017364 [Camellia sinensis]
MASNKGFDGRRDLIEAYVALQHIVAMFLTVLGHHHKNRNVKFNFMRSGQTVSKYFNDVLKAVLRLQGVLLKTPEPITAGCRDDRWRWFQVWMTQLLLVDVKKKGKGKATASSSRGHRVWTSKECDVLIRAMRDLFSEKWKADNGQFRCGFYSKLEKLIILAFLGTDLRASPHIESKIKFWRRQYNLLTDMLRLSGFGWDDSEKMILVDSDQVWQNYVKREPDAKGMRNVPFIYYEDWVILFGKDRATGVLAEGPVDMVDALEKEDQTTEECYTPIVDMPDCSLSASGTPCNQGGSGTTSKKRAREAEGIAKGLVDMAIEFGSFFKKTNTTMEEIAHRIGKLVNGELAKLRLNTNDRLRAATLIVKDAERVDLFFSLPEEEKMEWTLCMEPWKSIEYSALPGSLLQEWNRLN